MAFSISIEGTRAVISNKMDGDVNSFDDVKNDILKKEKTIVINEICINHDGIIYFIPHGMDMITSNADFNDLLVSGKNELAEQQSRKKVKEQKNESASKTKKCPFCAEEIKEKAIKCKHCGSSIDNSSDVLDDKDSKIVDTKHTNITKTSSTGSSISTVIYFLIVAFFIFYMTSYFNEAPNESDTYTYKEAKPDVVELGKECMRSIGLDPSNGSETVSHEDTLAVGRCLDKKLGL